MPEYIYGHRGARAILPENTMQAFQAALDGGANALETDVHLTSDGHVVVFHDSTGERIADTAKSIAATTLQEALTWDVGHQHEDESGNRPFKHQGFKMPLLKDVLEQFPDTRINIDIKPGPQAVAAVVDVIQKYGTPANVLLTSFSDGVRTRLKEIDYKGPIGLGKNECIRALLLPRIFLKGRWRAGTRIQVPPAFGPFTLASKRFISKAHAIGLMIDFWTIDDPVYAKALVEMGADGIMSDNPAIIAKALKS